MSYKQKIANLIVLFLKIAGGVGGAINMQGIIYPEWFMATDQDWYCVDRALQAGMFREYYQWPVNEFTGWDL